METYVKPITSMHIIWECPNCKHKNPTIIRTDAIENYRCIRCKKLHPIQLNIPFHGMHSNS